VSNRLIFKKLSTENLTYSTSFEKKQAVTHPTTTATISTATATMKLAQGKPGVSLTSEG
jgi:hypothetical protein